MLPQLFLGSIEQHNWTAFGPFSRLGAPRRPRVATPHDGGVLARPCPPVLRYCGLAPRLLEWPTPCWRPALPLRAGCATGRAGMDSLPLVQRPEAPGRQGRHHLDGV
jgi:hypothetical protein